MLNQEEIKDGYGYWALAEVWLAVDGLIAKTVKNAVLKGAANSTDIDPTISINLPSNQGPDFATTTTSKW